MEHLRRIYITPVFKIFLLVSFCFGDSSHNEQTQNGDDTAQEGSGQNDNEAELSDNEQTSPEDILQKDWGTVEFSLDGWIQREEVMIFLFII